MTHRVFADEEGNTWQVWEVIPAQTERRANERRRVHLPPAGPEVRQISDRRHSFGPDHSLPAELANGWLVFQCGQLKRRYWPLPPGWETLSVLDLWQLCQLACPVRSARLYTADLVENETAPDRPPPA